MNPKTKILIGILVIGIILISGWWIWTSQIYPEEIQKEVEVPPISIVTTIPGENQRGDFIELTGRIYSMGSEPFIQLGLETSDGEVYGIVGEKARELWRFRDKMVRLEGYSAGRTPRTEKSIEVIDYELIMEGSKLPAQETQESPPQETQELYKTKQAAALGLTPSEFKIVDTAVREYFYEKYPFLRDWPDFPIRYEKVPELENREGLKVIKALGRFRLPSPSAIFGFYNGEVYFIAEELQGEPES